MESGVTQLAHLTDSSRARSIVAWVTDVHVYDADASFENSRHVNGGSQVIDCRLINARHAADDCRRRAHRCEFGARRRQFSDGELRRFSGFFHRTQVNARFCVESTIADTVSIAVGNIVHLSNFTVSRPPETPDRSIRPPVVGDQRRRAAARRPRQARRSGVGGRLCRGRRRRRAGQVVQRDVPDRRRLHGLRAWRAPSAEPCLQLETACASTAGTHPLPATFMPPVPRRRPRSTDVPLSELRVQQFATVVVRFPQLSIVDGRQVQVLAVLATKSTPVHQLVVLRCWGRHAPLRDAQSTRRSDDARRRRRDRRGQVQVPSRRMSLLRRHGGAWIVGSLPLRRTPHSRSTSTATTSGRRRRATSSRCSSSVSPIYTSARAISSRCPRTKCPS